MIICSFLCLPCTFLVLSLLCQPDFMKAPFAFLLDPYFYTLPQDPPAKELDLDCLRFASVSYAQRLAEITGFSLYDADAESALLQSNLAGNGNRVEEKLIDRKESSFTRVKTDRGLPSGRAGP
jgi:hypothetical protein